MRGMDRREFVQTATGAALAAGICGCASLRGIPVGADGGIVRLTLADYPRLSAPDGFLLIRPAGLDHHVVLLALEGGEYAALSPICTHQGCTVDVAGDRLACPCHGSEYDRRGDVLRGPAERSLTRYPAVAAADGDLVIRLEPS